MVDKCKKCEHFKEEKKEIRSIDGSVSHILQYKCKKHHKIKKSAEGLVPYTRTYTCPDFNKV